MLRERDSIVGSESSLGSESNENSYVKQLFKKRKVLSQSNAWSEIDTILKDLWCKGKDIMGLKDAKVKHPNSAEKVKWRSDDSRPFITPSEAADNYLMNVENLTGVLKVEVEGKPNFFGPNELDLPKHLSRLNNNVIKMFPAFEKVKVLVGAGKNGWNVVGTWSERLAGERLAKGYMPAEAWILPIDNTELPNLSGTSCPRA